MIFGGFGEPLFLPANKNEYGQRFQLFRDCYIHINEAFKALRHKRCTQEVFGPLFSLPVFTSGAGISYHGISRPANLRYGGCGEHQETKTGSNCDLKYCQSSEGTPDYDYFWSFDIHEVHIVNVDMEASLEASLTLN